MVSTESRAADGEEGGRRRALLEAAVTVFMRYGYRKTSMEEVARAAQVSRQGLYLHFAAKEDLFRAAVKHALEGSLQSAIQAVRDPQLPLEQKLVRAFDAWMGRYVGMLGTGAADLAEATGTLIGPLYSEHESQFAELVARVIAASGLAAAYRPAGLTARQLADTLYATARGLKHSSPSREAFGRSMTLAVRALCLPVRDAS
jgi:AcrR family transcriptional regulator